MSAWQNIALRLAALLIGLIGLNFLYQTWHLDDDMRRYAPYEPALKHAAAADVIYLGDCSDAYCDFGCDSLPGIGDYLDSLMLDRKVATISANGFHSGTYIRLLEALVDESTVQNKSIIVTVNMRAFAPWIYYDAIYSPTIEHNLILSNRNYPPLLNRLRLMFNTQRTPRHEEMADRVFQAQQGDTLRSDTLLTHRDWSQWLGHLIHDSQKKSHPLEVPKASSYLRDFACSFDHDHERFNDLFRIRALVESQGWSLYYHLIPVNVQAIDSIDSNLTALIRYNSDQIINEFVSSGPVVIDNLEAIPSGGFIGWQSSSHFKQWAKRDMAVEIKKWIDHFEAME